MTGADGRLAELGELPSSTTLGHLVSGAERKIYIFEAGVKNLKFRYEFSGEGDEMRVEETKLLPVLGRLESFLQTKKIFFSAQTRKMTPMSLNYHFRQEW